MTTINVFLALLAFYTFLPATIHSEASISSSLLFRRNVPNTSALRPVTGSDNEQVMVTIRFSEPPSSTLLAELEDHGLAFSRSDGVILHTKTIYPASINLDSLDTIAAWPGIIRIEDSYRMTAASPLDVSNPLVQASQAWTLRHDGLPIDGTGVIIANVDTGIDIYNPAFFKPDGGEYNWIDVNSNDVFDRGIDAVDLNNSGTFETGELLNFLDASFTDAEHLMDGEITNGVFDAGIDWLYNDKNSNGNRDYGKVKGYTESSPSFGELFLICDDTNQNGRLDPGEHLTGLGTSKIKAIYASTGIFERNTNLLSAPPESQPHGTSAAGIAIGQSPGQRFPGIAPGAEIISINRMELPANGRSVENGILWAKDHGAKIFMHEFGSWIGEFLDGTSNYETMISEQTADGIHHFTASGNLAGPLRKKHAAFSIERYTTETLGFSVSITPNNYNVNSVIVSILWQSSSYIIRPTVTLRLSDGTKQVLKTDGKEYSIGEYNFMSFREDSMVSITRRIDMVIYKSNANDYISDDFFLDIQYGNSTLSVLDFDAYISDDKTAWAGGAQFTNFLTDDGTVTAPGTAFDDVTVGAFSPRGYRTRADSILVPGDICDFSGWGRTIDGRIAVDITAPGFTVFSPKTYSSSNGLSWGYVDFNGTSAALPFVTGSAALIVQAAPEITPAQLAKVLYDGAFIDEYVLAMGDVPNDTWGYGKLHIYDSLVESNLAVPTAIVESVPAVFTVSSPYPNPFNATTRIDVDLPDNIDNPVDCRIFNMLGQTVRHLRTSQSINGLHTIIWDGTDDDGNTVSTGIYMFAIQSGLHTRIARAVFLK